MNLYAVGLLIISLCILFLSMRCGFRKGMVRELDGLFSLLAAIVSLTLLAETVSSVLEMKFSSLIIGLIMLGIVVFLYKIFHLLFASVGLVARLPVIRGLDKLLGAVVGIAKGIGILYILEYVMTNYLLA